MEEAWKRVEEAPSYEVSKDGQVRNRNTGRVLKPQKNTDGLAQVSLREGGKTLTRGVNALVKRTF